MPLRIKPQSSVPPLQQRAARERLKAERAPTDTARRDEWMRGGARPPKAIRPTQLLSVLGKSRFVELKAARIPNARIAWVNFDLARELGFNVPAHHRMTPEFEKELLDALAYRILKPGEDPGGRATVSLFADRYGGSGIGKNKGTGRGGLLPYGDLFIKGGGLTPLADVDPEDFGHSTGNASHDESLLEARAGELSTNLFTLGSTRALAIIDTGDFTEFPDGGRERNAMVVRAGSQIRLAHFLAQAYRSGKFSVPAFLKAAERCQELVTRKDVNGRDVPDLQATMLQVIDRHVRTTAEQVRWRILHGAVSTSNMSLDGSLLDFGTFTTQERTAPIKVLDFADSAFGTEHVERLTEMVRVYGSLVRSLSPAERKRLHATRLESKHYAQERYEYHLQNQMLAATGLKVELARTLTRQSPAVAKRLFRTLIELMSLQNPGDVVVDKQPGNNLSVVDTFNLLRRYPEAYFGKAEGDRADVAKWFLEPRIEGEGADRERMERRVRQLSQDFVRDYDALMTEAGGVSGRFYESGAAFRRAIAARAAFENQPIPDFIRAHYRESLAAAVDHYSATGELNVYREAVDKTVAGSIRSVDGLLARGPMTRLPGGGWEFQQQTLDGITYSVRVLEGPGSPRRLHVTIPVDRQGDRYALDLPDRPSLDQSQLEGLRYHYTTDGWKTVAEVPARVGKDAAGRPQLSFDIPVLSSEVGRLEGVFHGGGQDGPWIKDGFSNYRGYVFAVPDQHELRALQEVHNAR